MREDYAKLVSELKKPGLLICEEMTPFKADLLHMAIGIMGEVVEYQRSTSYENSLEELGDIYFFLEGVRQIVKVPDDQYSDIDPVSLIHDSAELLDLVKKVCMYNKPLTSVLPGITKQIATIDKILHDCIASHGLTESQVIEANMAKLQKRYASGSYSNKQAIERADKS